MREQIKSKFGTEEEVAQLRAHQTRRLLSQVSTGTHNDEVFRAFLDASTEAIILADSNLNFLAMNQVALRLISPTSEMSEIIGKNIIDVVPGIQKSSRYEAYRKVIETGYPFVADDVVPHPSFGELYLSVRAFRVRDGMGLIVSDFTKQRLAEKARQISESRFRRLYDANMLAVAFWGPDGSLLDGNRLFEQITGKNIGKLKRDGVTHKSLTPPQFARLDEDAYRQIIENGVCTPYEKEFLRQDGSRVPVIIGGAALGHVDEGYVTYMIDNTERRKNEGLALRFEKLESLSLLAGGIAHDFNNLLSGIFGYMDLALMDATPQSDGARYLSIAMRTIDRARGITQQLLTFAKGGTPVKKRDSLFPLVEETVRFCLSGSNVACEFSVEEDLYHCDFDRTQIAQVIENIVINAQQAMPNGGTLTVVASNAGDVPKPMLHSDAHDWVCLSLSDTGVGIPEKLISQIFDPFFTTKQRGSGLGLATCHSIIRQHGGGIDVSSTPDEGTSFRIFLPAATHIVDLSESAETTSHCGSGTVLVMDDQQVVLDTFTSILENFGYSVRRTLDGDMALNDFELAQRNGTPYCAVVLDLTIPGKKGGLEIIGKIREIDKSTPVLVTSGYSNDPVMSSPMQYGFTDRIAKPFTQAELAIVLNRHL